jgi:hypothetical protein
MRCADERSAQILAHDRLARRESSAVDCGTRRVPERQTRPAVGRASLLAQNRMAYLQGKAAVATEQQPKHRHRSNWL